MGGRTVALGQVADQLHDIVGEVVRAEVAVPAQRPGRRRVGAWGASEPKVDPARVKRLERAELLGDDERRVVGKHHAARADPEGRSRTGEVRDEHRGSGAGDCGHTVVLRHPEPVEAESLGCNGELSRLRQRLSRS